MFSWAVTFFIIALIAAIFGFFGIAASAAHGRSDSMSATFEAGARVNSA